MLYPKGGVEHLLKNLGINTMIYTDAADKPLLYIINTMLESTKISSTREINQHPDKYKGKVITFTANGHTQTTSLQETIKKTTDKKQPIDILIHTTITWNTLTNPPKKEELLPLTAASSHHQDTVITSTTGKYTYTGKVLTTKQINKQLPEQPLIIIYHQEKTGTLNYNKLPESAKNTIEQTTTTLTTTTKPTQATTTPTKTEKQQTKPTSTINKITQTLHQTLTNIWQKLFHTQ